MRTERYGDIELLRFIVAMAVLLFHAMYFKGCPLLARGGYIGVEFFFLLSGYLMAAHIAKKAETASVSRDCYVYLWHRLLSFWPELLCACIIGVLVFAWGHHGDMHLTLCKLRDTIVGNIFLLDITTLGPAGVNGAAWFLGALMLSSAVVYPVSVASATLPCCSLPRCWLCESHNKGMRL